MVTASITSPASFAEHFCTFMIQQVAANTPLTARGPQPQDINYYMGPSQTGIERPLGILVRTPFLPSNYFNENHAKSLGRESACLEGVIQTACDERTNQADKPRLTSHAWRIALKKTAQFRQRWMDEHGIRGTVVVDVQIADMLVDEATVLAASNDLTYQRFAADKLQQAASHYAVGGMSQSAAAISEISALLYLSAARSTNSSSSSAYPDEMLLQSTHSLFRSANYWLGAPLGMEEKGIGVFRGIRNWLEGSRLYDSYKYRAFAVASRYAPHELEPRLSEDTLLASYLVQYQELDPRIICTLLDRAARWHNKKGLKKDAANDRLFKLFHEMKRMDYILSMVSMGMRIPYDWNTASKTLERAASVWKRSGKPTDVVTEMRKFASDAKAIGEKG